MGRRGIRVILVLLLLGTALASIHGPAVAAQETSKRARAFDDLQLDGFGSSGRTFQPDTSTTLERGVEEGRTPQVVVGSDTRTQVTDTTLFPYSAVAHLELYEDIGSGEPEGVAICSAAFVGPNVLLTAAHCLWDDAEWGGFIDRVIVVPGANGDIEPFGFGDAENYWIPDGYTTNSDPGSPYDYGLVILGTTEVEAQTGSFEIGILATDELLDPNFNPTTAGYPGDKDFGTQWVSSEAAFDFVDGDGLINTIDSVPGQSGSPVWRGSDMAVVGVVSAENDTENLSVRLDIPIMYELMTACQELGCKINHFLSDIPGDDGAYDRVWARTDQPVASGAQARTWMWGPQPISKVMFEPYAEAPNGFRTVLYQEKSRMEITDPNADSSSIWYVTNGLATVELMTGNLQLGNSTFEQHEPAEINVAGDGDDPNGPTYVTFAGLRDRPPSGVGSIITATVDRAGNVGDDSSLAAEGVTAAHLVAETQHSVASVFWEFMNSSGTVWQNGQYVQDQLFDNAFFATGYPVTEAYWATVRIGGVERTVLVQAFERRVLTYTPGNPEGFLVEAGNVGSHYLSWLEEVTRPGSSDPGGGDPPSDNPPPAIGDLLGSADFANWPEVETTFGDTGAPYEDGYRIRNPPTGFLQVIADGSYGNAYYTVEARAAQASAVGGASCLIYRADVDDENPLYLDNGYWFCLYYEGPNIVAAVSLYETTVDIIELGGVDFLEPLPQASDWHQIGVVAEGSEFWFIVDGEPLGSIVHDIGPGSGQVGMLSFNFDESEDGPNAVYDYRNLEIYSIAGSSTPEPPPPPPGGNPPTEGDVVYQTSLGDLPAADGIGGATGQPSESGSAYNVVGPPESDFLLFDDVSFSDASYSIDVFSLTESGAASGCLIIRATASGDYNMCVLYGSGSALGTISFYFNLSTSGDSFVDLGSYEFPTSRPADESLTLKVITEGSEFWFYVDGELVGSATHGSGDAGAVGISMTCVDASTSCAVGFTNLVVRSLAT